MRVEKTDEFREWIGDKSTQAKDITKALELNRNFVE